MGVFSTPIACRNTHIIELVRQGMAKAALHDGRLHKFWCDRDDRLSNLMLHQDVEPTLVFGVAAWGHYGPSVNRVGHEL